MSDEPAAIDEQKVLGSDQPAQSSKTEREAQAAAEQYSKEVDGKLTMHVKVHSPFNTYYEGPAFSISAENATGPFDILPEHHSFISLLSPCDLIVRSVQSGEQKIRISGGIMHVKADEVIVFLDV
jgi:hypothetical protein